MFSQSKKLSGLLILYRQIVAKTLVLTSNYGLFHLFYILCCASLTKFIFKNARLVRLPIFIRGRKNIVIGSGFTTGIALRLDCFSGTIQIGSNVEVNDYCHIGAVEQVIIGDNVLIASKVLIIDHNHGDFNNREEFCLPPAARPLSSSPVIIGNNVWLGEGVLVLPGVEIGANSVVGAGSVVTKSMPSNALVAGNPASVIKIFTKDTRRG